MPAGFRFSVKAPRAITHDAALAGSPDLLVQFVEAASLLGEKLGPLLFQLPPRLAFDPGVVEAFFGLLRSTFPGPVALEPRHATWCTPETDRLLARFSVARVAADPARVPEAAIPAGWAGLAYFRLHGSPRTYYSRYGTDFLSQLAERIRSLPPPFSIGSGSQAPAAPGVWVIFDNTASGAAIHNALELAHDLTPASPPPSGL